MSKAHWSVAGAKAELSRVIELASATPQVIEKRGKPVAVVVSIADFESAAGALGRGSLRGSKWQRFLTKSAAVRATAGAVIPLARREARRDPFR